MTAGDVAPVERCEAAAVFVTEPKPPPHPAHWHGIFVHRFLEYVQTKGPEAALQYLKRKRGAARGAYNICSKLDLSKIPRGDPEVTIVIEPSSGTASFATYSDADVEHHIVCRLDLIFQRDRADHFLDFKTGDRAYDPIKDDQFRVCATGLWLALERPPIIGSHAVNITISDPRWTSRTFDAATLEAELQRLKRAHARMLVVRAETHEDDTAPSFTPGPHCASCRARFACKHAPKEDTEGVRT